MELRLDDNSLLTFEWAKSVLNVQLFRPGNTVYGHGWILRATALLDGAELKRFLDEVGPLRGREEE